MLFKNKEGVGGSRLLLIFSQHKYLRRKLPMAGSEGIYRLLLEKRELCLNEDYELQLYYSEDGWCLNNRRLLEGMPVTVCTVGEEKLLFLLSEERTEIIPAGRLRLGQEEIRLGRNYPNAVFYDCNARVFAHHASFFCQGQECFLEDYGPDVYVNEERMHGRRRLDTGDRIDIYGLHLLVIQEWLICTVFCGSCHIAEKRQNALPDTQNRTCLTVAPQQWIERSYEEEGILHTGEVELIMPQQAVKKQNTRLFLSLGPSLTMIFPVMLMALLGNSLMGGNGSGFYYMAAVMTGCSSCLAVFWGAVNHFYRKHMDRTGEISRRKQYREYLDKLSAFLEVCRQENRKTLTQRYPPTASFTGQAQRPPAVSWNRYYMHHDFLFLRLGTGEIPFQLQVKLSDRSKHIVPDKLIDEAGAVVDRFATLADAPQGIDFYQIRRLGMLGGTEDSPVFGWLRQLLLQIAACHCYTELKTVCFYREDMAQHREFAACIRWLPHNWSPDRKVRYLAGNEQDAAELLPLLTKELENRQENEEAKRSVPWYLFFVLNEELIQGEVLYHYLTDAAQRYPLSAVFVAACREELPRSCRCMIGRGREQEEIVCYGDENISRNPLKMEMVSQEEAQSYVREISGLRVREAQIQGQLPDTVDFLELYGCRHIEELNCEYRWNKSRPEERLKAPIGCSADGEYVNLDVHEKFHGPHGLIAGTTGSGKSELLQTYLLSMAITYSPQDVIFFMIDYKGGGTGNVLKSLPHCAGVISNLSGNQIKRAMSAISSENKRRQKILSAFQINHIDAYTGLYREGKAKEPMPHLILVVDEFAELKKEEPEFMQEIISLAQVGRSLGVHLILATQKPAGTVDDKIWSNARFRLCLRVQDRQDSMDMLHCTDAATLTAPGQCYLQIGNHEYFELFQTAYCGGVYTEDEEEGDGAVLLSNTGKRMKNERKITETEAVSKMELIVRYLKRVAGQCHFTSARQLWMPELPTRILLNEIKQQFTCRGGCIQTDEKEEFILGLCDDPENQSRSVLRYEPQQGHLVVCGGPAAGKSTFLQTILWQICTMYAPERMQFLLVDIGRGSLHCFEGMPHCLGLLKNREQKNIFFYHLKKLVERRKAQLEGISCLQYNRQAREKLPLLFIVVDGYGSYAQILCEEQADFMQKLAAEGVNYGIYLLLAATGMGEIPARLYEKIRNTVALAMSDRFQYGDVLRQYHLCVFPKENVQGRGLCRVEERILEFQAVLACEEADDYARLTGIRKLGKEKSSQREHRAMTPIEKFPCIPEKLNASVLAFQFRQKQEKGKIPLGYSSLTGEIAALYVEENVKFVISGVEKSGCSSFMNILAEGLLHRKEEIIWLNFRKRSSELHERAEVTLLSNEQKMKEWQTSFEMKKAQHLHILIDDLAAFCDFLYKDPQGKENASFWEELCSQTVGLVAAIYRPQRDYCIQETTVFQNFAKEQRGIHLGGNPGAQRLLCFDDLSYTVMNQWEKAGAGYWKNGRGEASQRLILPEYEEKKEEKEQNDTC